MGYILLPFFAACSILNTAKRMVIVQLSTEEISELVRRSVREALEERQTQLVPSNTHEDKILNVREAAEFLQLSVNTVYAQTRKGDLPYMKRYKRLYYSQTELTDYLKAGRRKTNSEREAEAQEYLLNRRNGRGHGK
jgi:predicted DNA-binding transcriptional regulator AlpA